MRRFEWRSVPALAVGLVCLWILGSILWALRPVWVALWRGAREVEWVMYTTVGTMLGVGIAARFASHVLEDIAGHRRRVVGCLGALLYRATRIVMWFMFVAGGLATVGLGILVVMNAFLVAVGS